VFINGVRQQEGTDYEIVDGDLSFAKPLAKERLTFWRWTAIFLALFGTYGKNDMVDVEYTINGTRTLATGLEIYAPDGSESRA